jgi:hypothetical protein
MFGQVYRMDGNVILSWIESYIKDRINSADETGYALHCSSKEHDSMPYCGDLCVSVARSERRQAVTGSAFDGYCYFVQCAHIRYVLYLTFRKACPVLYHTACLLLHCGAGAGIEMWRNGTVYWALPHIRHRFGTGGAAAI